MHVLLVNRGYLIVSAVLCVIDLIMFQNFWQSESKTVRAFCDRQQKRYKTHKRFICPALSGLDYKVYNCYSAVFTVYWLIDKDVKLAAHLVGYPGIW